MRSSSRRSPRDGGSASEPGSALDSVYDLGRFRLDDLIVGDATEGLWRAYDQLLKRTVAVRLVPRSDPRQEGLRAAACVAARVVDHRVARVLDVLDHETTLLIVTEWVDGIPLEQLLRTPVSPARALAITRSVVEAITQIHAAGTTHGRLRPASVMLTDEGEIRLRGHCIDAQLFGVAPGGDPVAADIHGTGAIMMACLTARWPGSPATALRDAPIVGGKMTTPAQLMADLPDDLNEYVVRALAAVPSRQTVPVEQPFKSLEDARNAITGVGDLGRMTVLRLHDKPLPEQGKGRHIGRRTVGILVSVGVIAGVAAVGGGLLVSGNAAPYNAAIAAPSGQSATAPVVPQPRLLQVTPSPANTQEKPLPIAGVSSFDPQGEGIVRGSYANYAVDKDVSTAWYTDTFKRQNLGKVNGTGLIIDLGGSHPVRAVELGLVGNDTDLQIRTAQTLSDSIDGYKRISFVRGAPGQIIVREPRPVTARYVLIWLTAVPWSSNGYRGGISSVKVRGN